MAKSIMPTQLEKKTVIRHFANTWSTSARVDFHLLERHTRACSWVWFSLCTNGVGTRVNKLCYEHALVCLSNREIVNASRGRTFHCKMANKRLRTVFLANWFGLIYVAI